MRYRGLGAKGSHEAIGLSRGLEVPKSQRGLGSPKALSGLKVNAGLRTIRPLWPMRPNLNLFRPLRPPMRDKKQVKKVSVSLH